MGAFVGSGGGAGCGAQAKAPIRINLPLLRFDPQPISLRLPMQALCGALFPAHARLVLQRLMEVVQRGAERYQQAAIATMRAIFQARPCFCFYCVCSVCFLQLLQASVLYKALQRAGQQSGQGLGQHPLASARLPHALLQPSPPPALCCSLHHALLQVPGLDLGPTGWPATDPAFTQQLSQHLRGPLSGAVLDAFRTMLRFQGPAVGGGEGSKGGDQQGAAAATGETEAEALPPLEWPRCMDDLGASNKLCSEALERVMRACPGSAQLLWGSSGGHTASESLLPFLSDPASVS